MKKVIIIIVFLSSNIFAQVDSTSSFIDVINYIIETRSDAENEIQLFEELEDLYENPIDMNNCNKNDLRTLPISNDIIFVNLFENRPYKNVQEVKLKNNLDDHLFVLIKYFIKISDNKSKHIHPPIKISFRSRLQNQLETPHGFEESYIGSKPKVYNRLKTFYGKYFFSSLIEKDSGEESINDFMSFSFQAKDLSIFNEIIIGDYLVKFGQGLALWSPYAFSKGIDAVNTISKKNGFLKPYSSSDENKFFRGITSNIKLGEFNLIGFYSRKEIDASFDENTRSITALRVDGFHRTSSEIDKKDKVEEIVTGFITNYSLYNKHNLGILFYNASFSNSFEYINSNSLHGDSFNFYSISYNSSFNNLLISSELSSNTESFASIVNIKIRLSKNLWFVTSFRNYPSDYYNLYSNGFGERTGSTQNERGFYSGFKLRLNILTANLYFDQFKFPSSTFGNLFPRNGNEFLINISLKPFHKFITNLKYKNESKSFDNFKRIKKNYRVEFLYSASKNIRLKSRIELVNVFENDYTESGFLTYQDLNFKFRKQFSLSARFIIFDTRSYNSRIYEYENDLTGVMNNAGLFGKGYKWYLLVNYSLFEYISFSFKYSQLYKPHEKFLSSGNQLINSNKDSRLSFQIDVKLN